MDSGRERLNLLCLRMRVAWTTYPSPVGPLTLAETDGGPVVVAFAAAGRSPRHGWVARLMARHPRLVVEFGPCVATRAWLDRYFAGTPQPSPWWDGLAEVHGFSAGQAAAYRVLCEVPFGETRSYEEIARPAGVVAREAGRLMGANPLALLVPCHRVVGKDGALVGYGGGLERKRWLLAHELRAVGLVLR